MFSQDYLLHDISVRGEVSNCKYHSTGHVYFTLKEEGASIACVLFAGYKRNVLFRLEDGQNVIVRGSVESYIRDGKYQIYAKEIIKDGEGELYLAFETLKKKLSERGMFDEALKREIPKYAKTIGIVTAPTGAAVRDIISVSKRRNPYIQLILYPAIVQGEYAAASIVSGINALETYGVDLIIVGRGGGSMEDLWAFNEEVVAHAIFQCEVPVISAVGHETDFTIADFVADVRAATPSAAAELAVTEYEQIQERINKYNERLNRVISKCILDMRMNQAILLQRAKHHSPLFKMKEYRLRSMYLCNQLDDAMMQRIKDYRNKLSLYAQKVYSVSPVLRLNGGMAYLSDTDGKRITEVKKMHIDEDIRIRMRDGAAIAKVLQIEENETEIL